MKSKLKEYSTKKFLTMKEKFKEVKEITGVDVLITGAIAISALCLVLCDPINRSKEEEIDMKPVHLSVQECDVKVDGKESIYKCKEISKTELLPELKEHYNNIYDTCVVNPKQNNRIDCIDVSKSTIKELSERNKRKFFCLTNKDNQRLKCFRK